MQTNDQPEAEQPSGEADCSAGFLSRAECDELRCTAHEIIIRLMDAKNQTAISLLKQHCETALEKLGPPPIPAQPDEAKRTAEIERRLKALYCQMDPKGFFAKKIARILSQNVTAQTPT